MNQYLKCQKVCLSLYLVFIPISCFCSIAFALSIQPLFDAVMQMNRQRFLYASFWAIVLGIGDIVCLLLVHFLRVALLTRANCLLKDRLFERILSFSYSRFCEKNKEYLSVLNNDSQAITEGYFMKELELYRVIWSFLLSLATVSALSPVITAVVLGMGLLSVLLPHLMGKRLDQNQRLLSEKRECYFSDVGDSLNGFLTIISCSAKGYFLKKHGQSNQNLGKQQAKTENSLYLATWISMLFSSVSYLGTLILGGALVLKGYLSLGGIVSISQLIGGIVAPLEQVPAFLAQIRSTRSLRKKCEDILYTKEQSVSFLRRGNKISAENLSFQYPNSKSGIFHFSFSANQGGKYIIVGASGSGKSTLAKLLGGLYSPDSGVITIPHDISAEEILYLPQKAHIFSDTLRNNLTLGKPISDLKLKEQFIQLGLQEFFSHLPNGWNEVLKEDSCSGGEAQRIAIARAVLREPKILILDEATSALDDNNRKSIERMLFSLPEVTVFEVTHRIDTELLSLCDGVFSVENGRLISRF